MLAAVLMTSPAWQCCCTSETQGCGQSGDQVLSAIVTPGIAEPTATDGCCSPSRDNDLPTSPVPSGRCAAVASAIVASGVTDAAAPSHTAHNNDAYPAFTHAVFDEDVPQIVPPFAGCSSANSRRDSLRSLRQLIIV